MPVLSRLEINTETIDVPTKVEKTINDEEIKSSVNVLGKTTLTTDKDMYQVLHGGNLIIRKSDDAYFISDALRTNVVTNLAITPIQKMYLYNRGNARSMFFVLFLVLATAAYVSGKKTGAGYMPRQPMHY